MASLYSDLHGIDSTIVINYYTCSTKYIGGHADLVGGAASYAKEEYGRAIHECQILLGTNMVRYHCH